ncbi:hypothetical protein [Paenibacillus typhae]
MHSIPSHISSGSTMNPSGSIDRIGTLGAIGSMGSQNQSYGSSMNQGRSFQ